MKKAYAAPTLISNGSVVRETLSVSPPGPEGIQLTLSTGRLGYDL
jgi:uncharacterized protein YwbE